MSDTIPTGSPINAHSLQTQNKRLYDHLASGHTINFQDARGMGIPYLNSRISDLRADGVEIHSRFIHIRATKCKEHSLQPFVNE